MAALSRISPRSTFTRRGRTFGVSISPDGSQFVTANYFVIALSQADRGSMVWEVPVAEGDAPNSACFTPDGKRILVGSSSGKATLLDARTGKTVGSYAAKADVHSVAIAHDGKRFLLGARPDAELWMLGKPKPTAILPGKAKRHPDTVKDVAFLPDAKTAMFTYWSTLAVWDVGKKPAEVFKVVANKSCVASAAPCPDGTIVTIGLDGELRWFDPRRKAKKPVRTHATGGKASVSSMAVSGDAARALVGEHSGVITLWNLVDGVPVAELRGHKEMIDAIAISPDGKRAVSTSLDHNVHVWDLPAA